MQLSSRAAIVLCGGQSSRMGLAKWSLPFGPESMLERIVRLVCPVCPVQVVVAAQGQQLPPLPGVVVARDRRPRRGPLEGLAAGLRALPPDVEAAYVTSCDVPLLVPHFVARMFALLGDSAAAVPGCGGRLHPLAAVYRPGVLAAVDALLADDRLRPTQLRDAVATRVVVEAELTDVDPQLLTLTNLNGPGDYFAALAAAGYEAPPQVAAALARG